MSRKKTKPRMPVAMTIAGSDPTSGAGLQADLLAFARCGVYSISAVTSVTRQDSRGVKGRTHLPARLVRAQIETVVRDIKPAALKTGMLGTESAVRAVADCIKRFSLENIVVDPVAVSSSGAELLSKRGFISMLGSLFPLARVVTPNIPEAERITGIKSIDSPEKISRAAGIILAMGAESVVIKGGHMHAGPGKGSGKSGGKVMDYFFTDSGESVFEKRRVNKSVHGTGCVFSAYIASFLARGESVADAVWLAESAMAKSVSEAVKLGGGNSFISGL